MKNYRQFILLFLSLLVFSQVSLWVQAQEQSESGISEQVRTMIHEVRAATTLFHDIAVAQEAGYGKFLDCFKHGDHLGMGHHYVNGDLVGDDLVDPLLPEALVYEQFEDGNMALVAFEYLVFADVWDPDDNGREAPALFGQAFSLKTDIPDTPPVWALHIWLWTHNPQGMFADYNPLVFCRDGDSVIDMSHS